MTLCTLFQVVELMSLRVPFRPSPWTRNDPWSSACVGLNIQGAKNLSPLPPQRETRKDRLFSDAHFHGKKNEGETPSFPGNHTEGNKLSPKKSVNQFS